MRVLKTRTTTGSELFSLLTCLHTTTFTLLSIFSPLEMIYIKIWETPLPWQTKCSFPVAVRLSKTRVLKLTIVGQQLPTLLGVTCCVRLHILFCVSLRVVARSLKLVKLLSQQIPPFLLLRDHRCAAQQCCIRRLHSSSNIVGPL